MAGKVSNFTLGTKGINLVDEPLSLQDGDLQNAQNAEFRRNAGRLALGKRGGLARLNGTDLGGSVLGGANVPLPSPLTGITRTFYVSRGTLTSNPWVSSTNGTSWADSATPDDPQSWAKAVDANYDYYNQRGVISYQGKLVYAGDDYVQYPTASDTAPPIRVFDGITDIEIGRVPLNPAAGGSNTILINDFCVHMGRLFFATYDPGGSAPDLGGRVIELDLETGQMTQIGNSWGNGSGENAGGCPYTLASHNGLLWAGTYGISGSAVGKIYSFRVDVDSTWTLRVTSATGAGYIMSMVSYRGVLYFGTQGDAGSAALVRTLATDNTTTATSDTGSDTSAFNYYAALIVYNSELYAVYCSLGAGTPITHIRKFDGSSWTTDLDVDSAQVAAHVGMAFVHSYDTSLLIAFLASDAASAEDGFIYRKVGGVWTAVKEDLNCRGFVGRVDVVS